MLIVAVPVNVCLDFMVLLGSLLCSQDLIPVHCHEVFKSIPCAFIIIL